MFDKPESKACIENENDRRKWRKWSKTLSTVKLVENISKDLQGFLEISPVQKRVLLPHKLKEHTQE